MAATRGKTRASAAKRATRTERAGEAASESACKGVRGAKPLGITMITIDGSAGEGGGQVLRTALALSLVTGRPFRIDRIRAGRAKSGLLRQHLTAVQAAADVGRARVSGSTLGSATLAFEPGAIQGGEYAWSVGTAGSATLVLQAVLPALLAAREASTL